MRQASNSYWTEEAPSFGAVSSSYNTSMGELLQLAASWEAFVSHNSKGSWLVKLQSLIVQYVCTYSKDVFVPSTPVCKLRLFSGAVYSLKFGTKRLN